MQITQNLEFKHQVLSLFNNSFKELIDHLTCIISYEILFPNFLHASKSVEVKSIIRDGRFDRMIGCFSNRTGRHMRMPHWAKGTGNSQFWRVFSDWNARKICSYEA